MSFNDVSDDSTTYLGYSSVSHCMNCEGIRFIDSDRVVFLSFTPGICPRFQVVGSSIHHVPHSIRKDT